MTTDCARVKRAYISEQTSNGRSDSNTAVKLSKRGGKNVPNCKPFVKGDPRINRNGRPKSFDQLRKLAQTIAHAEVETKQGDKITVADNILREWAASGDVAKQKAFVEYAFGKVPDKIESTGLENKTTLVLRFDHENGVTNGSN